MKTQNRTGIVRLGEARRRTQADQETGVLEEIPVHRFRTVGWAQ